MSIIGLMIAIPATLYIALSLPPVQRFVSSTAERELSALLAAKVEIGSLSIMPFERVLLRDVNVTLDQGRDTVLTAGRLGAGIDLRRLLLDSRVEVKYVELIDARGRLYCDSVGAPLNIDPIIKALQPKDKTKPPSRFNMAINQVVIRNLALSYDVMSTPRPVEGRFSPAHMAVRELSADVKLPNVGSNGQHISVKRLRFKERSGLEITDLKTDVELSSTLIALNGVEVNMPNTRVGFQPLRIENPGRQSLGNLLKTTHLSIATIDGCRVTPSDFAPLWEKLSMFDTPVDLSLRLNGSIDSSMSSMVSAAAVDGLASVDLSCVVDAPLDSVRCLRNVSLRASCESQFADLFPLKPALKAIIDRGQRWTVSLDGSLDRQHGEADVKVDCTRGSVTVSGSIDNPFERSRRVDAKIATTRLDAGALLNNQRLGLVELTADGSATLGAKYPSGTVAVNVKRLDWEGHPFGGLSATASANGQDYSLKLSSSDPAAKFRAEATGQMLADNNVKLDLDANVYRLDLGEVIKGGKWDGYATAFNVHTAVNGSNIDDIEGGVAVTDVCVASGNDIVLDLSGVNLRASTTSHGDRILTVDSDIFSGRVRGYIAFSTLVQQVKDIAMRTVPTLAGDAPVDEPSNRFVYDFKIHDMDKWAENVKLPVKVLGEASIHGVVNYPERDLTLTIDAPYIKQGASKLIERTRLEASVNGVDPLGKLSLHTETPTKQGMMPLDVNLRASNNNIDLSTRWHIDRAARYDGDLSLSAVVGGSISSPTAHVRVNPGQLTFNDSTWNVKPATVSLARDYVHITGLDVWRAGQYVKIDGTASPIPSDVIEIDLLGVNIDYIFESLGLDKVLIGGDATGRFYASELFTREPHLDTPGLRVNRISYNKVVLGDAIIKSSWDTDRRAVTLDAIVSRNGVEPTLVDGAIYPLNDSIDITFYTHSVDVGFLRPYMSAFASDISGRASGPVRLCGTFKNIDIEGDVKAENLLMKIAFTNVAYTTSDSVILRRGSIRIPHATVRDMYGNTATLDGTVKHKCFRDAEFKFDITNAKNLMMYDETPARNTSWYGRIFGDGRATISGAPGVVNVDVAVSTGPNSNFSFVLNDSKVAGDYTFITYRDRDLMAIDEMERLRDSDTIPDSVRRLRRNGTKRGETSSSEYNIALQVDVNNNADINLVMDPVSGDRIRSRGSGNLRLTYGSRDNLVYMRGGYTLERGVYNFTLQDIILKDFSIKPGSKISFMGDPMAAMLDISAFYSLNANLSDLDESFLQDKDLNRTKVPVHAILNVTGPLQQPELSFDLEFPTLTQDVYRKVRSIVSTDEMMNRQIIYLLALNRFYTPDYMASATRGNELMSVASSTISSQLSNILGGLSDKWNIAPTFRSDRGDFSDVEVDVALSSNLLNNRLLFNGNFGYRDKALNNTQFVGDFDIEYLLNRAGSLRLKAYNRYNDLNYYVRTAATTQGVGISLRHNFDSFTDLIRAARHEASTTTPATK